MIPTDLKKGRNVEKKKCGFSEGRDMQTKKLKISGIPECHGKVGNFREADMKNIYNLSTWKILKYIRAYIVSSK